MSDFDTLLNKVNSSQIETQNEMVQNKTFFSNDGKWAYQISIIDYLQTFDFGKKQEVFAKKWFKNADPKKLSAVPPDPYGSRFVRFMKEVFEQDKATVTQQQKLDIDNMKKELEQQI